MMWTKGYSCAALIAYCAADHKPLGSTKHSVFAQLPMDDLWHRRTSGRGTPASCWE